MAGTLIGRLKSACPSCGFTAMHVKRNPEKLPYAHCPECGIMIQAKNGVQAQGLLTNTRAENGAPGPLPEPPKAEAPIVVPQAPAATPAPAAEPAPPVKRASHWATLLDIGK